MGKAQSWQRKRGDEVAGPLAVAGAMLGEILEELPRLCLAHRRLSPEAPGRTRALMDRLRAARDELSKVDLLGDELREAQRIIARMKSKRRR